MKTLFSTQSRKFWIGLITVILNFVGSYYGSAEWYNIAVSVLGLVTLWLVPNDAPAVPVVAPKV